MANHEATCPACGSTLLIVVNPHTGGTVEESIGVALVLSEEEQLAQRLVNARAEAEARAARAAAEATTAAQAVLAAAKKRQAITDAAAKLNADKVAAAQAALGGGSEDA